MLLSFPHMHPTLSRSGHLPGLRFFDPGMTEAPVEGGFRPEGLPLDPRTAAALIRDCVSFGEQFKDPGEMAYFGAMTPDEFYEGSAASIQSQLLRRFAETPDQGEGQGRGEAMARAQFIMLLAWFFEEKAIELAGLEQGVKASWRSMDTALGLDDEDRADERMLILGNAHSHTGGVTDGQAMPLPWQRMIEALPTLLPGDAVLVCAEPAIIAAWADADIVFETADPESGLPEGARVATQPAWRFAGRRKPLKSMPDTERELTIAIIG
ncbi:hypothetical protein [Pseudodesulfovibrio pelocollis]|uniref:hypothetical protein n=1 Tax=Pseudodesulfovibrio pelocollis TaxID=3051432 RepID=UPI00255AD4E8|nr:hypothetical protein [Pseudodesulfovibrio sp. SB368]